MSYSTHQFTSETPCANCGGEIDFFDAHLTECWETIGEFYCAECWDEMGDANAAYDREDSA